MFKVNKKTMFGAICALLLFGAVYADENHHHEQALENNAAIRAALKRGLPTSNISINANQHILQVIGFVESPEEMRNLIAVLDKYQQNDRVINNVKIVKSYDSTSDEKALRRHVYQALKEHKLPVDDISVEVRNGHVIAGGFINKHIPAKRVGEAIKSVPGAQTINNYVLYKS